MPRTRAIDHRTLVTITATLLLGVASASAASAADWPSSSDLDQATSCVDELGRRTAPPDCVPDVPPPGFPT